MLPPHSHPGGSAGWVTCKVLMIIVCTTDVEKLALTSPTGGGRSVGIVRLRTKATEFFFATGLKRGQSRKRRTTDV